MPYQGKLMCYCCYFHTKNANSYIKWINVAPSYKQLIVYSMSATVSTVGQKVKWGSTESSWPDGEKYWDNNWTGQLASHRASQTATPLRCISSEGSVGVCIWVYLCVRLGMWSLCKQCEAMWGLTQWLCAPLDNRDTWLPARVRLAARLHCGYNLCVQRHV